MHTELAAHNFEAMVVLGHPEYYPRFGYAHDARQPVACKWAEFVAFMIRGQVQQGSTLHLSKIIEDA